METPQLLSQFSCLLHILVIDGRVDIEIAIITTKLSNRKEFVLQNSGEW